MGESENIGDPRASFPVRRLTIIGVGLLGGSIGLAARSIASHCQIIGYGHQPHTLDKALAAGAITQACDDPGRAVHCADLIILCTPVGLLPSMLQRIIPHLSAGAVVTDVGSTKRSIVAAAGASLGAGASFVGSHPIAGSEKRGVENARADLFRNALCIITPTSQTNPQALALVESFWRSLGMRLTSLSPDDHDRLLADVSHLPHAIAAALLAMQDDAALSLAGRGFLDSTRIAAGDAGLWRDIFHDNRDHLRASLLRLRETLDELSSLLDSDDGQKLTAWLQSAAQRRSELASAASNAQNPRMRS